MTPSPTNWAVVTGAGSGIGAAVTSLLLDRGYGVVAVDRDERILNTKLPGFVPSITDVSEPEAVRELTRVVNTHAGYVRGLVNCAGVGGYTGDIVATVPATWDKILATNLTGSYLVSRAVLPAMPRQSSIVNIASQYALVGGAGFPAYCAAKAGLLGLTRAMAVDHAAAEIRVNCVCPGPVDTPLLRASSGTTAERLRESERTANRSLLDAPASPVQIATVIAFLLDPASNHITGAIIPVDGGWSSA